MTCHQFVQGVKFRCMQMILYVHAKTKKEAAFKLNTAMANVTTWLENSHLCLNVKKTVCMFFTKTHSASDCDHKVCVW